MPNADVLGDHVVGQEARLPADGEDLVEVVGLPEVDHVDDPVGVQVAHPTPDRGQVAGGVAEAPVALADDHRRGESVDEDAQRPVVDHGGAVAFEFGHDRGQVVVVGRLPVQIPIGEQHAHPGVRGVEAGQRDGDQLVPDGPGLLVPGLQGDDPPPGLVGERLVGPEVRAGPGVQGLGLRQGQRRRGRCPRRGSARPACRTGCPSRRCGSAGSPGARSRGSTRLRQSPMIVERR